MNNYQDWAQLVAKKLEHESTLLGAIDKEELDDAAATEAFVRAVLQPFLPKNFGIGSGRVVDAFGNYSEYLDIIVFNHNYPRIGMRGTHSAYLYESVLAAFAIRAKFVRKSFADALDACASLAALETRVDKKALQALARKNGLKPGPNNTFVHQDPLRTARFELIGRPLSFVFGFSGFKYSYRQLQENIELWFDNRKQAGVSTPMKCLPAVIATQGCFAWRNAAPLALSGREMLGIGNDDAPVRLIVLQLLHLLNRRLQVAYDGYGLKPSLDRYLSHFSVPKFAAGVGKVAEVIKLPADKGDKISPKAATAKTAAGPQPVAPAARSTPSAAGKPAAATRPNAEAQTATNAKPATGARPATEAKPAAEAKPAIEAKPAAEAKPAIGAKPATEAKPATTAQPAAKTAPPATATAQKSAAAESSGVFDKPPPSTSQAKPESPADAGQTPESRRSPVPSQPLGSAPIPQAAPAPAADKPAAQARPGAKPPPPLDITLDGETFAELAAGSGVQLSGTPPPSAGEDASKPAAAASRADDDVEDWSDEKTQSTIIITPDASLSAKEKSKKSGDEFIAQVKKQMSSAEPIGED